MKPSRGSYNVETAFIFAPYSPKGATDKDAQDFKNRELRSQVYPVFTQYQCFTLIYLHDV